jgi:hypothetical protein
MNAVWRLEKRYTILLKWIFGHYSGYIVSATSQMRIPSMPGVHQFLVANSAPGLEAAFASQTGSRPTTVVFHGTSLDRLYSILCKGLQNCSGDSLLQRNGAVHGNGIYVADEPVTALQYAHTYQSPGPSTGWNSSKLNNVGVLLGLEASANIPGTVSRSIHVVVNPSMLILRYIFLVPMGVSGPLARHVVPAMTSVFASLRSGSL